MLLQDLFNNLALGELSKFSFAEGGLIKDEAAPQLVSAINQSLLDLHTRFQLINKELHILCLAHKTIYPLRSKYASTSPVTDVFKYILDTHDYPFEDDLIQILSVTDEFGNRTSINDPGVSGSIFIPRFDTIQVLEPRNDKMLSVIYQARHPKIHSDTSNPDFNFQEIVIHPALQEALLLRTAYRILSPMDRKEQLTKVALLDQKYELLCVEAEHKLLLNNTSSMTTWKLESRGFI